VTWDNITATECRDFAVHVTPHLC